MRFILYPAFCLFFYTFSYYISLYFVLGDQVHYQDFYNGLLNLNIRSAFEFYKNTLGTSEPVYFLIVYFVSDYISKNVFFSLINTIFSFLLLRALVFRRVNSFVIILLFSNFYFFVLLFSAERLKIALLFLLLSFAFRNIFFKRFFQALSVLAHVQTVLLVVSLFSKNLIDFFKNLLSFRIDVSAVLYALFFVFLFSTLLFFMNDHIYSKLNYYISAYVFGFDSLKIFVFLFMTMYYSKDRWVEALISFLPLILMCFIIGSERVVIFSFFIFIYYAIEYRRGLNAGVLISGLYFMVKGFYFINDIIVRGDGFYCTYNVC